MSVKLVFLGRLEDAAGRPQIDAPAAPYAEVVAGLDPALHAAIIAPTIRLALNGALLPTGAAPALADGDELAFLPPVSGG